MTVSAKTIDITCKKAQAVAKRLNCADVASIFTSGCSYVGDSLTACIREDFFEGFESIMLAKGQTLEAYNQTFLLREILVQNDELTTTSQFLDYFLQHGGSNVVERMLNIVPSTGYNRSRCRKWILQNVLQLETKLEKGLNLDVLLSEINFSEVKMTEEEVKSLASKEWARIVLPLRIPVEVVYWIKEHVFSGASIPCDELKIVKLTCKSWSLDTFYKISRNQHTSIDFYLSRFPDEAKRDINLKDFLSRYCCTDSCTFDKVLKRAHTQVQFSKEEVLANLTTLMSKCLFLSTVGWLIDSVGIEEGDIDGDALIKAGSVTSKGESRIRDWLNYLFTIPKSVRLLDPVNGYSYSDVKGCPAHQLHWAKKAVEKKDVSSLKWILRQADIDLFGLVQHCMKCDDVEMLHAVYNEEIGRQEDTFFRSCFVQLYSIKSEEVWNWMMKNFTLTVEDMEPVDITQVPRPILSHLAELKVVTASKIMRSKTFLIENVIKDEQLFTIMADIVPKADFLQYLPLLDYIAHGGSLEKFNEVYPLHRDDIIEVAQFCVSTGNSNLFWIMGEWPDLKSWELLATTIHAKSAAILNAQGLLPSVQSLQISLGQCEGDVSMKTLLDLPYSNMTVLEGLLRWYIQKNSIDIKDDTVYNEILSGVTCSHKKRVLMNVFGRDIFSIIDSFKSNQQLTRPVSMSEFLGFWEEYNQYKDRVSKEGIRDLDVEVRLLGTFKNIFE